MVSAVIVFRSLSESQPLLEIGMYVVGDVFNLLYRWKMAASWAVRRAA